MKIINGKIIAKKISDKIALEVFELIKKSERRPSLAIILIGDRDDSRLYVSLKEKLAKELGIDTNLYLIEKEEKEENILNTIDFLNNDDSVDGILIQLPLPAGFDTNKILQKVKAEKDVDGFNLTKKFFLSPVLMAIKYSLDYCKQDFTNKKAFLIYNSEIFKKEVESFLKEMKISFDFISSADFNSISGDKKIFNDLKERIKSVDIFISAVGQPCFINKDFLRDGQVVIDIGISKKDAKVFGDVDVTSVSNFSGFITPVPGGIGPITVACLLSNVLDAFKMKLKK